MHCRVRPSGEDVSRLFKHGPDSLFISYSSFFSAFGFTQNCTKRIMAATAIKAPGRLICTRGGPPPTSDSNRRPTDNFDDLLGGEQLSVQLVYRPLVDEERLVQPDERIRPRPEDRVGRDSGPLVHKHVDLELLIRSQNGPSNLEDCIKREKNPTGSTSMVVSSFS